MKKKYLAYAIFPVLALVLAVGGTSATVAAQTAAKSNPFSTIAAAIAKKFNLNSTEVQTVIDETMQAERTQMEKDRLAQAVTDGKLTQAQADLIVAKRAELQTQVASFSAMTAAERQAAMQKHQADLKAWATANNIPEQYVLGGGRGGHGGGRGMMDGQGFGRMGKTATQTTAAN